MKVKSCEMCRYSLFVQDESVGIPYGMEACDNPRLDQEELDEIHGYLEENPKSYREDLPEMCGDFTPRPIDAYCPLCGARIQGNEYEFQELYNDHLQYRFPAPYCSKTCRDQAEAIMNNEN